MPYDDSQPRDKDGKWTSGGSSGGGLPPSAYAAGLGSTAVRMAQMQDRPLYPNNSKSDPYLGTREQFRAKNKAFVRLKKSQGVDIDEEEYLKEQDKFYTFKFKQRKANRTG